MNLKRIIIIIVFSSFISCFFYVFIKPHRNNNLCLGKCNSNYNVYDVDSLVKIFNDNNDIIKDIKKSKNIDIVLNDDIFFYDNVSYSYIYNYFNNFEYILSFLRNITDCNVNIYLGKINSKYVKRKSLIMCNNYSIKCIVN